MKGCKASEPQSILDVLSQGKLVAAIMGRAHFIVLRTVQDGKILVADPASTSLGKRDGISPSSSNKDGTRGPGRADRPGSCLFVTAALKTGRKPQSTTEEHSFSGQNAAALMPPLAAYLALRALV